MFNTGYVRYYFFKWQNCFFNYDFCGKIIYKLIWQVNYGKRECKCLYRKRQRQDYSGSWAVGQGGLSRQKGFFRAVYQGHGV